MRRLSIALTLLLLAPLSALAQDVPGTVKFPAAADSADSLIRASNSARSTLSGSINSSATTVTVVSTASFPSSGAAMIDNEIIFYTAKSSTTLTGVTRGADSTSAAAHSSGAAVRGVITAAHHNTLAAAIVATQNRLLSLESDDLPATLENKAFTSPTVTGGMNVTGTVSATAFVGNGAGITGLTGATGGVSNTGSTTIAADTDGKGVGKISFQTGSPGVERMSIEADGSVHIGGQAVSVPFNVRTYGAVGDGTANDTSAVNAAIAALNSAGGGVLYFPRGTYKVASALTTITAPFIVRGDGAANARTAGASNFASATRINFTSATARLFTVTAMSGKFEHIALVNTAGSTPSAGCAVKVATPNLDLSAETGGDTNYHFNKVDFDSVYVSGFYDNIDVLSGINWTMTNSVILSPVRYGIRIRNLNNIDGGDWTISHTLVSEDVYQAASGIRIEGAGGGKLSNVKVNGAGAGASANAFNYGIDMAMAHGTSIFQVTNCSVENWRARGISLVGPAEGFELVEIANVQFGTYNGADGDEQPIYLENIYNSTVDNVIANTNYVDGGSIVLLAKSCKRIKVGAIQADRYNFYVSYDTAYDDTTTSTYGGFNPIGGIGVALQNTWAAAPLWGPGGGTSFLGVTRMFGKVELKGMVYNGTVNSLLFTLPVGFRPRQQMAFRVFNGASGDCAVVIAPDGTVTQSGSSAGSAGANYVALDGISFIP